LWRLRKRSGTSGNQLRLTTKIIKSLNHLLLIPVLRFAKLRNNLGCLPLLSGDESKRFKTRIGSLNSQEKSMKSFRWRSPYSFAGCLVAIILPLGMYSMAGAYSATNISMTTTTKDTLRTNTRAILTSLELTPKSSAFWLKKCETELERRVTPLLWWAKKYHRTEANDPIDFRNWKHMIGPYSDNHRDIVCMKDTQSGWTLRMLAEVWFRCANGWSVFYVLPTQTIRNTFVKNRVDTGRDMVPYYGHLIDNAAGHSDEVGMKHIGSGVVKFVGSNAFSEFGEFPADMLVIDEYDRCDQENLPFAYDRLDASDHKCTRILGNPTIEGTGIHPIFDASDQRYWTIPCPHCGEWQALDWFKNVVRETGDKTYELIDQEWKPDSSEDIRLHCVRCNKPMDRLAVGEWTPTYPDRSVHGYHFNKLAFHKATIAELWDLWCKAQGNEHRLQNFYNSKLGIPYSSASTGLSRAMLDALIQDYVMPSRSDGPCFAGIDVGNQLHIRIDEKRDGKYRAVYIGTVNTFEEADLIVNTFNVSTGVIDARPETRAARQFIERQKGTWLLCQYVATDKVSSKYSDLADFWMEIKYDQGVVNTDRTQSMDASHARLVKGEVELPKGTESIPDFYDQMIYPKRLFDEKRGLYYWSGGLGHTEQKKPDHYRHAENYKNIAARIEAMGGGLFLV